MSTFTQHFSHVETTLNEEGAIIVQPVWKGVDRPRVGGYSLAATKRKLAARLAAALASPSVYSAYLGRCDLRTDIHGQTYISAFAPITGRTLNADLKRLGF
jgi:hypothetical protein